MNRLIDDATSLYNIKKKKWNFKLGGREQDSRITPPGVIQGGVNGPIRVNILNDLFPVNTFNDTELKHPSNFSGKMWSV